jgi:uncharacterized protein YxeA
LKHYWTEQRRTEFSELKQEEGRLKKSYSEFGVEEKSVNQSLRTLQDQHQLKVYSTKGWAKKVVFLRAFSKHEKFYLTLIQAIFSSKHHNYSNFNKFISK